MQREEKIFANLVPPNLLNSNTVIKLINGQKSHTITDFAKILYEFHKNKYKYTSFRKNSWFEFKNNNWIEIDGQIRLFQKIAKLRENFRLLQNYYIKLYSQNDDVQILGVIIPNIIRIIKKLEPFIFRLSIVQESKYFFYGEN